MSAPDSTNGPEDPNRSNGALSDDYEYPPDNGLRLQGLTWDIENVYDYESGGHHPVHIGDVFHERYRVIHKLGHGGYSTVWLCHDSSEGGRRYVALKIMMAEVSTSDCPELRIGRLVVAKLGKELSSQHFCLPLDKFEIEGPNGIHYVFVYPVLGPRVSEIPRIEDRRKRGVVLRKICLQAASGMAVLHENGICHGDFRPANILIRLSGLDDVDEEELLKLTEPPRTAPVIRREGGSHDMPSAPQYLVYPIDWAYVASSKTGADLITHDACITDFGESYEASSPPSDLGIPEAYCSPEFDLEKRVGGPCDIWALACTLFEIRCRRDLFGTFEPDVDEHLSQIALVLGKLPEPWWSETWEGRRKIFKDDVGDDGKVLSATSDDDVVERQRSLREAVAPRYTGALYELNKHHLGEISDEEVDLLSDLLGRLLRYVPEERISAREALQHGWFKFSEAGN